MTMIQYVRLGADVFPAQFDASLRESFPRADLAGSLLGWLSGDRFYLSENLRQRVLDAGYSPEQWTDALRTAGAKAAQAVEWPGFLEQMSQRVREPLAAHPAVARTLRGLGDFEAPAIGLPVEFGGRSLLLDWQIVRTGISQAWSRFGGTDLPWAGIKVAHIDTGYTPHPALGWQTPGSASWVRAGEGLNLFRDFPRHGIPNPEGIATFDDEEPQEPRDNLRGPSAGHGTRTMSVISGHFDTGAADFTSPFFGAAPGVAVVPYRICDFVVIDNVNDLLAQAVRHAVDSGCDVISISLGGIVRRDIVQEAIEHAYERGVIVCAAAGNVVRKVTYPGAFRQVITVGGATTTDGRDVRSWSNSSHGPAVDISAPADRIRRADTLHSIGRPDEYVIRNGGDGTSFATALCAGAAVLWLAQHRAELAVRHADTAWKTPAAFKRLLQESAERVPGWNSGEFGAGLLDADALLSRPLPDLGPLDKESN